MKKAILLHLHSNIKMTKMLKSIDSFLNKWKKVLQLVNPLVIVDQHLSFPCKF